MSASQPDSGGVRADSPGVKKQLRLCREFIGVVFAVRLEEKNRVGVDNRCQKIFGAWNGCPADTPILDTRIVERQHCPLTRE